MGILLRSFRGSASYLIPILDPVCAEVAGVCTYGGRGRPAGGRGVGGDGEGENINCMQEKSPERPEGQLHL